MGVGCPEHAQVGPLPRLSKSRLSGLLVGVADSGVPLMNCWATRTSPTAHRERLHATRQVSLEEPPECEALPAALDRPGSARRASGPGGIVSSETRPRRGC